MKKQIVCSIDLGTLRQEAEILLQKKKPKIDSQLSESDALRILHELQVHQIELEMQNHELKVAKEQAEVASQKYLELYDFAPSGYFTLSKGGIITELNLSGSQMLGKERQFLKNYSFEFFVSTETKPIFNLFLRNAFDSKNKETCELTISSNDNLPMYVILTGIVTENRDQCIVNVVDITRCKKAEESVKMLEELNHASIVQTAMDGYWMVDMQGLLLEVNETYCQMSGYNKEELLKMRISDMEAVEAIEHTAAHMGKVISQKEDRFETRHRRKDGSIFDVEINALYIPSEGGRFVAFLHDISERKTTERYREMAREILQILNEPGIIRELIHRVLAVLKTGTGFDAVGIRLEEGDDFPYISQKGFSKDFLLKENTLIDLSKEGGICRDNDGKVCLACTCGLVISEKNNQENPFFTPGGSFWTNNSFPLLDIPPAEEARFHPRNQCIHQGYASVALVPIRNKDRIVGLLQFNDRLKERFTRNTIEKLEGIASHIGAAIMRKHAEETLKESEKRRLAILETAMDGFWLLDMQGRLLEVNETYCRMSGYTAQELRSMHISDLESVEAEVNITTRLQNVSVLGDDRFESRHRRKDGSTFDIEISIQYQPADGQFVTFLHDITERKRAEEELKASELKFRKYVDYAPHGIFVANEKGEYIDINSSACKISGYSKEELLSMKIMELVPEESMESAGNHFKKVVKEGFASEEFAFIKKDRSKGYWSVDAVKLSDKLFLGFTVDITLRKAAEENLRQSEERYKSIFQNNHSVMLLLDPVTGEIKDANPAASIYYGWSHSELIRKNMSEINTLSKPEVVAEMRKAKEEKRNHFFFKHQLANSEVRDVEIFSGPIIFRGITLLYSIIHDITDRKRVEEALKEREHMLRESQSAAHISSYSADLIAGKWKASSEIYEIFGIDDNYPHTLEGWVASIHPDFREELVNDLFHGETGKKSFEHEYKIIRINDGMERWVQGLGELEFDNKLKPVKLIGTIQDITKRKLFEEELKHLYEDLEDRVKERTTELLKSNIALRQTEEKYRTVADFTYGWEYWLDQKYNMLYCSPSCERITGYKASAFIKKPKLLFDIIHPDDANLFHCHKQMEDVAKEGNREIQYRIVRFDGSIRWIGHVCQPIFDKSGNFIGNRGSNRDITGRKEIEQQLKTSNQKYKLLSENITDGIFICRNGYFEYFNKVLCHIFGFSENELDGWTLTRLVMPDYHEELENFLTSNAPLNQNLNIEIECLKKDLSTVFVEILLNYVANEGAVYGVVHDISEKKQIQKNIVKAIIQTEEKERANFSKELHDGLGPLLSTIKLYLQWSERPKTNISREEIIRKAEDTLEDALAAVKEISNKLSPHLLIYYGLTSAIQSFASKVEETSTIRISFESNIQRRIDMEIESALYRAVIECINNTLKHAFANNITIILHDSGGQLLLQYCDDGIGFELTETLTLQKGLGLFNLQNRIHTIGGKITMFSNPGKGVDYQIIVNT